jgi:UDP-hydrolysing UDP-N-acetyl-D-glucosamine 2-epimerase
MRRLAVLTSGRQDWGIVRSTCLALQADARFDLRLLVGGMHCSPRFGQTERLIGQDGFAAAERLDWIGADGSPGGQAGRALAMLGAALERQHCDAILLVGDRFETASAAVASTIARVPIAHLHGGEETMGSFDDAFRHAISKMSHLHLASHPEYAARLEAIGETRDTIHVVGAPGLDNAWRSDLPDRAELERTLGIPLTPPVVIVTLHPTTLRDDDLGDRAEVEAVVQAMDRVPATYVITLPNADPGDVPIRERLASSALVTRRVAVEALGERAFWGLLQIADAMLGNSSSALIEAPVVRLPAVNIGARQDGRIRAANVIDVSDPSPSSVTEAMHRALDPATRERLAGTTSPFGDGHSAARIVAVLADWQPPHPPRKAAVPVRRVEE